MAALPCISISPLRGFSAVTQLQISMKAERHMSENITIVLCEQAPTLNCHISDAWLNFKLHTMDYGQNIIFQNQK